MGHQRAVSHTAAFSSTRSSKHLAQTPATEQGVERKRSRRQLDGAQCQTVPATNGHIGVRNSPMFTGLVSTRGLLPEAPSQELGDNNKRTIPMHDVKIH